MELLRYAFKQPNDWTCGPAVLRAILHAFGIRTDITQLVRELKTTRSGTGNTAVIRLLQKHDLDFRMRSNASIPILKRYLKNHWVMIAYHIPRHNEFHYSIVRKIDSKRIYFHDTWYGSSHSYSRSYFSKIWWDNESRHWLLAIRKD